MSRTRSWLLFGLKALVSTALIAVLLNKVDVSEAAERARALPVAIVAAVLALLCAYIAVSALRWLFILRALGANPGLAEVVRITFVAAFFNQFLPSTVGADAVRVWESWRGGMRVPTVVDSVILDRAGYFLGVSALAALGVTFWRGAPLPAAVMPVLWLVVAAILGLVLALLLLDRFPARILPALVARGAVKLAQDSRALLASPTGWGAILGTALANQALLAATVYALARGLGIQVALADCAALLPAVVLLSAIPISVAGWGVREVAMVTGLNYAGVTSGSALVLSLALGIFYVLASTPGGALWLLRRRSPGGDRLK